METAAHRQLILDQFTKQAIPFAELKPHSSEDSLRLVIETAAISPQDTVLDVACGPGLITCAVAQVALQVTGIDLTPAMIEQAKIRQQSLNLTNLNWQVGDACPLPFADQSFTQVLTRYSFHHFQDPRAVFLEMVRVCKPGGTVCVVDVFTSSPEQGKAYDRLETLRDPSHVRGLALDELTGLFYEGGLINLRTAFYKVEMELEKVMSASFPDSGDAETVRRLIQDDVGQNKMGLDCQERNGHIHFAYPIVIVAGTKP